MLVSTTRFIATACFRKDISRVLPIFSITYGIILALAGYYATNVEMGNNVIEAFFIGLSAGAAATGFNQVGKQLYKDLDIDFSNDTTEDEPEDVSTQDEIDESFGTLSSDDLK
jgi:hypothetical protein